MNKDLPGREMIDRAEDLILRIRDVRSCRITTDETGAITEINVIASTEKPAKMIARDVEAALKAELGLMVDYRKIGVVLIGSAAGSTDLEHQDYFISGENDHDSVDDIVEQRLVESLGEASGENPEPSEQLEPKLEFLEEDSRIRFGGLTLTMDGNHVDVGVKLRKNELDVIGCCSGPKKDGPDYKIAAEATIKALMELLDEDFHLCLSGIEETDIAGRKAMVAVVQRSADRETKAYSGCAFTGRDPNEAAVLAVLNAVNRPFGTWKTRKEIHYRIR